MKKYLLLVLVFYISSCRSQILSEDEEKLIDFMPVRTSFEDTIVDPSSRYSFKEYMKVIEMDSLQYPTIIFFRGKFKNNLIDVYDLGKVDIFNLKRIEYKKYISFENVTSNPTNNYTDNQVFLNNSNKNNSYLILLDKRKGVIINNSNKYHFIYIYYNENKKYWHILYSNYLDISQ